MGFEGADSFTREKKRDNQEYYEASDLTPFLFHTPRKQIKRKYSLPFLPTHKVEVVVKAGSEVRLGIASRAFGSKGGGVQVEFIRGSKFASEKMTKAR